jgi:hypothetical protein
LQSIQSTTHNDDEFCRVISVDGYVLRNYGTGVEYFSGEGQPSILQLPSDRGKKSGLPYSALP